MSEAERDKVEKEYLDVGKKDWHQLTFDQMRACTLLIFSAVHLIPVVYTIAYGSPDQKDPNESKKVFFGTVAMLGASIGLFAFIRSFGTHHIYSYIC